MKHGARMVALIAAVTLCRIRPFVPGSVRCACGGGVAYGDRVQLRGAVARAVRRGAAGVGTLEPRSWIHARSRDRHADHGVARMAGGHRDGARLERRLARVPDRYTAGAFALWKGREWIRSATAAAYFLIVPAAATVIQLALAVPITEFSRTRAIQNAAPFIADLERYRATHGRYPQAVPSLWDDYRPAVVGISQYHYQPAGESYNLSFEQLTFGFGARELVIYNPRDEHVTLSHDSHGLRLAPGQMGQGRGTSPCMTHRSRTGSTSGSTRVRSKSSPLARLIDRLIPQHGVKE